MLVDIFIIILRFLHIVSALFWVGAALMLALFVEPAAQAAGPAGSQFMQKLALSKYGIAVSIAGTLTVLAGFILFFRLGYGLGTIPGQTFLGGGIVGLIGLIYGGAVTGPAAAKMGRLGAATGSDGKPPATEQMGQMQALQAKLAQAGRIQAVLVTIAGIMMAVARYL